MYAESIGHCRSSNTTFLPLRMVAQTVAYGMSAFVWTSVSLTIRWNESRFVFLTTCIVVPVKTPKDSGALRMAWIFMPCHVAVPSGIIAIGIGMPDLVLRACRCTVAPAPPVPATKAATAAARLAHARAPNRVDLLIAPPLGVTAAAHGRRHGVRRRGGPAARVARGRARAARRAAAAPEPRAARAGAARGAAGA